MLICNSIECLISDIEKGNWIENFSLMHAWHNMANLETRSMCLLSISTTVIVITHFQTHTHKHFCCGIFSKKKNRNHNQPIQSTETAFYIHRFFCLSLSVCVIDVSFVAIAVYTVLPECDFYFPRIIGILE